MKVIKPSVMILHEPDGYTIIKRIEQAGRVCYKSNDDHDDYDKSLKFVRGLIKSGHESVLEHVSVSVEFICDRGISHELVRHRIASFSQESTRYCNYSKSGELTFIKPCFWDEESPQYRAWYYTCKHAEETYLMLIKHGSTPQEARTVLPNSLKTEVIMTANLREWRHFLKLRALGTTGKPHPQMAELAIELLCEFNETIPVVFEDIHDELYEDGDDRLC